jgi:hypothetical protein
VSLEDTDLIELAGWEWKSASSAGKPAPRTGGIL